MPTIREILVGYQAVNEREREEMRQRLSRLTVDESLRQYLRMRALARRVAPDLEHFFAEQRKAYYVQWHERLSVLHERWGMDPLIEALRQRRVRRFALPAISLSLPGL